MRDGFGRSPCWLAWTVTAGPKRLRILHFSWTLSGMSALGSAAAGLRWPGKRSCSDGSENSKKRPQLLQFSFSS